MLAGLHGARAAPAPTRLVLRAQGGPADRVLVGLGGRRARATPVDAVIPREECHRRDAILRAYLLGRDWDLDAEQKLRRSLVLRSHEWLSAYPFLVGVEWRAPDGSPGDLLFFDGQRRFAAVEVKALGSQARTKRRGDVERQARVFATAVRALYPESEATALVYTDDEATREVGPRSPDVRW